MRGRYIKTYFRPGIQLLFLIIVVIIGIRFGIFVNSLSDPGGEVAPRPPGVEAFLPISSLMSVVYFLTTGIVSRVHPAGFVIFSLTIILAFAMRKGFCGWMCPIGLISEYAHKTGKWLFGKNIKPPKFIDIPLQGIKYLLAGFFLYSILMMPVEALESFIGGPYNRMADVKMYLFFANISTRALAIILIILAMSILIKNFWCRYLCPYGALLGVVSLAGPMGIVRDEEKCIGCGKCAKACHNSIPVDKKKRANSAECMACYSCVNTCPSRGALRMAAAGVKKPISLIVYGASFAGIFILVTQAAAVFSFWKPDTTPEMYKQFNARLHNIGHPTPGNMADTMEHSPDPLP